jgi:hypothetical protein
MPSNGKVSAVPLTFDFTAQTSYAIDFTSSQWYGKISNIQSAYVDNSGGTAALSLYCPVSGGTVTVPAGAQAYVPLVIPSPAQLTFTCLAGTSSTVIILMNVPMPVCVWFPTTTAPAYTAGALITQDTGIASALSGVPISVATPTLTLVNRSVASPASPASFTLMAANPARKYLLVKAPETADLWVNPIGGTASLSGLGCLKIAMGTAYESPLVCWQQAITAYCATGSLNISAYEG